MAWWSSRHRRAWKSRWSGARAASPRPCCFCAGGVSVQRKNGEEELTPPKNSAKEFSQKNGAKELTQKKRQGEAHTRQARDSGPPLRLQRRGDAREQCILRQARQACGRGSKEESQGGRTEEEESCNVQVQAGHDLAGQGFPVAWQAHPRLLATRQLGRGEIR